MEQQIIKALFDKDTFLEYSPNIKAEDFNKGRQSIYWHVLNVVKDYYASNEQPLDIDTCKLAHKIKLQGASETERERILAAYEEIEEAEVGEGVEYLFMQFKQTNLIFDIQQALDDEEFEKWEELSQELITLQAGKGAGEDLFTTLSLVEAVEKDGSEGMTWFMPEMNEFSPKLTRGTGTLIVARSNCGKTSLIAPQAIHLLNSDFKVLHCALSEDGEEELLVRYIQAAYNITEDDIMFSLEKWSTKFEADFGEHLRILNTGVMHIKEIEKRVNAFKPDCTILDQYQKVMTTGNKNAGTAEQRTKSAEAIKDLAKKYNFHYLCATQADAQAGWTVTDLNIDQAKTGVVGDFKTIIGLGKQDDDRYRSIVIDGQEHTGLSRKVNIAKNKGKMGSFETTLLPETCEWR